MCGPSVAALARAEARTGPGEIHLTPAARRRLRSEKAPRKPTPWTDGGSLPISYLPPHLFRVPEGFPGEFRRTAAVFVETRGWSLPALQRFTEDLFAVLEVYDGSLISTDVSPHGVRWLCAFGAPTSHESDPERAGRASLELASGKSPARRAAVNVGVVATLVVGNRNRRSYEVLGDVVNIAARALSHTGWGQVVAAPGLWNASQAVSGVPLGKFRVKGKSHPLELHRITSAQAPVRHLEVSTPLVGRDQELARLDRALNEASGGSGTLLGICGDAGLGKSRLKWEVAKLARGRGLAVHEGRSIEFGGGAYWPILAMIRNGLGISESSSDEQTRRALRANLERSGVAEEHELPLLGLLGVKTAEALEGESLRAARFAAIEALLEAWTRSQPQVFVLEDMHWADQMSTQLLSHLAPRVREWPCLCLLLYRPGFSLPDPFEEMSLAELGPEDIEELLESLVGNLPSRLARLAYGRSGGNPLYVEEGIRHVVEIGALKRTGGRWRLTRPIRPDDLPGSLESLLSARLDRLSPEARTVAGLASVIGRSFLLELLGHFSDVRDFLDTALAELKSRELVFPRTGSSRQEYIFKHNLIRDAAYSGLLLAERRRIHRGVAKAIEIEFADDPEFDPMLAHHWERAGDQAQARRHYLRAARRASRSFENVDALRLYRHFLSISPQDDELQIAANRKIQATEEVAATIEMALGPMINLGQHALASNTLKRAARTANTLADPGLEAESLDGLMQLAHRRGDLSQGHAFGKRALRISRRATDPIREGRVLVHLSHLLSDWGRKAQARELCQHAVDLLRQLDDVSELTEALIIQAHLLESTGRPVPATAVCREAVELARRTGRADTEAAALGQLCRLHITGGNLAEARAAAEQSLSLHRRTRSRDGEARVLLCRAMILSAEGQDPEADLLVHKARLIFTQIRDRQHLTQANLLAGDLELERGDLDAATRRYQEAFAIIRDLGDMRLTGIYWIRWARLSRYAVSEVDRAHQQLRHAARLLEGAEDLVSLVWSRCEAGHCNLSLGHDGQADLEAAEALNCRLELEPDSAPARRVAALRRAVEARGRDEALIRGTHPSDVTPRLLSWCEMRDLERTV